MGAGKGRLDDQLVQVLGNVGQRLRLAAPPRRDRRDLQLLVQQELAQSRQERGIGGRFGQARTEGVGDGDLARAHRLHQAGNAQHRIAAQFERIAEVIVLAAHDNVDGKQPAQGFQKHAVIAHGEVAAFDQRVAEVSRQEGVFEISLVIRTRRQQHNARILALLGHQPFQRIAVALEEIREPADVRLAEYVGQHARGHQPVFECISGARRRLRAIRQHPPLPVRRPRQIGCVGVQENASRRLDPPARPQKGRIRETPARPAAALRASRRCCPYRSARIRLNSVARWMMPASMAFHSAGSITSGIGSSGQGREVLCGSL